MIPRAPERKDVPKKFQGTFTEIRAGQKKMKAPAKKYPHKRIPKELHKKAGQKGIYSESIGSQIAEAVRIGNTLRGAARIHGINARTAGAWFTNKAGFRGMIQEARAYGRV